jgi:hypothetical protein
MTSRQTFLLRAVLIQSGRASYGHRGELDRSVSAMAGQLDTNNLGCSPLHPGGGGYSLTVSSLRLVDSRPAFSTSIPAPAARGLGQRGGSLSSRRDEVDDRRAFHSG